MDASLAMMQQHVLSAFSAINLMEIFAYQTVKDRAALAYKENQNLASLAL